MADPVLIVTVAVSARELARWLALRTRVELARLAAAAPGTEVVEQDRHGGSWRFRSPRQPGEARG
ncbi:MAG TPA: hypothetical protein VG674_18240 [Amycolatopsis sp.]|nr:hypothetical protein [Amycolatopsis sp.]